MTTIILSDNCTDFTTYIGQPIDFAEGKKYEAAMIHLSTYNSIPNITAKNNIFKYYNGSRWKTIELPPDAYEYKQIADEIKLQLISNKDYDHDGDSFYIKFDIIRLSSLIEITHKDYKIDFGCENSIGPTLGFSKGIIGHGRHKSPNIVNIINVNSILVNVDFIGNSYLNGNRNPVIYEFYPEVAPGYRITVRPNNLIYLPINRETKLDKIRLWLTDQDL